VGGMAGFNWGGPSSQSGYLASHGVSGRGACQTQVLTQLQSTIIGIGGDWANPKHVCKWQIDPGEPLHAINFRTDFAKFEPGDALEIYVPNFLEPLESFHVNNPLPAEMQLQRSNTAILALRAISNQTHIEIAYECTTAGFVQIFGRHFPPLLFGLVVAAAALLCCSLLSAVACYVREERGRRVLMHDMWARTADVRPDAQAMQNLEDQVVTSLKELPTREYEALGPERVEDCIICLDRFERGDLVLELQCGHIFHRQCIDEWFMRGRFRRRTCPLCQRSVLPPPVPASRRPGGRQFQRPQLQSQQPQQQSQQQPAAAAAEQQQQQQPGSTAGGHAVGGQRSASPEPERRQQQPQSEELRRAAEASSTSDLERGDGAAEADDAAGTGRAGPVDDENERERPQPAAVTGEPAPMVLGRVWATA